MNNEITAQQSAYNLPSYGRSIDWSFIQSKEQYLLFVAEYKKLYDHISKRRKRAKLVTRAFSSFFDNATGTEHGKKLMGQVHAIERESVMPWLTEALDEAMTVKFHVEQTKGHRAKRHEGNIALAGIDAITRWLLALRVNSKVVAQKNWLANNSAEPTR